MKNRRPKSQCRFSKGDRVKVKESGRLVFVRDFPDQELLDRVSAVHNTTRIGTVVDTSVKLSKVGARQHYVTVLWDLCGVTSEHHQMRLMLYPSLESHD
jgi:hypothetical protein